MISCLIAFSFLLLICGWIWFDTRTHSIAVFEREDVRKEIWAKRYLPRPLHGVVWGLEISYKRESKEGVCTLTLGGADLIRDVTGQIDRDLFERTGNLNGWKQHAAYSIVMDLSDAVGNPD